MAWEYGKLFDDVNSFLSYLSVNLRSKITEVHVHHTLRPDHKSFNGKNHRALQDGMKRFHVKARGFQDIAQHLTVYPDGSVMTGRNPNVPPASAQGYNDSDPDKQHPFMFEMVGNFDRGHDTLEGKQLESAILITKFLMDQGAKVRFHNQCLIGGRSPKTCPGTSVDYDWFVSLCKSASPSPVPKPSKMPYKRLLKLRSSMMRGDDVKAIQKIVGVPVDGWYGKVTRNGVIAYQKKHGLLVDGIVGKQTWGHMFK